MQSSSERFGLVESDDDVFGAPLSTSRFLLSSFGVQLVRVERLLQSGFQLGADAHLSVVNGFALGKSGLHLVISIGHHNNVLKSVREDEDGICFFVLAGLWICRVGSFLWRRNIDKVALGDPGNDVFQAFRNLSGRLARLPDFELQAVVAEFVLVVDVVDADIEVLLVGAALPEVGGEAHLRAVGKLPGQDGVDVHLHVAVKNGQFVSRVRSLIAHHCTWEDCVHEGREGWLFDERKREVAIHQQVCDGHVNPELTG